MTGTVPAPPPGFQLVETVPPPPPGFVVVPPQSAPRTISPGNPFAQFAPQGASPAISPDNPFAQFATPPGFVAQQPGGPSVVGAGGVEIELEDGTILEFPPGTPFDVVQRATRDYAQRLTGANPDRPEGMRRALTLGAQSVGRGVADVLGAPADLSTGAANLALGAGDFLLDAIFGENSPGFMDYRFPPSPLGSEAIAGVSSDVAEALGLDMIPREEMTPGENARYEASRFGTGAAVTAGTLSAIGNARRAEQLVSGAPRTAGVLDRVTRPYAQNPGRTAFADTTGGAGAGAALSYSQSNPIAPENPVLQGAVDVGAMFLGGLAGNAAGATLAYSPEIAQQGFRALGAGSYTNPETGALTSGRTVDAAAASLQGQATYLPAARETLRETMRAADRAGVPRPTPGAATGDTGLKAVEAGARRNGSPVDPTVQPRFEARDEAILQGVREGIGEMVPENADLGAGLEYAQGRPGELARARDAAALPVLQSAYDNGARVNLDPVLDTIARLRQDERRPNVLRTLEDIEFLLMDPTTGQAGGSPRALHTARMALGDMVDGRIRSELTGQRYSASTALDVRRALDQAIAGTPDSPGPIPEFRQFLDAYREGSRALDVFDARAVSRLVENETDLRNTARSIFSGNRYGTENEMRQMMQVFQDNPEAMRSWKAAVSEVLIDRVTQTRDGSLSYSQLRTMYDRHRGALSEIYTPDEMERLDNYNRILGSIDAARSQARHPGIESPNYTGVIEAGLLASGYDAITVGMVMRRLRVAAQLVGAERLTINYRVERLLEQAQFDPDLYALLLERPLTEGTGPRWSADVRAHLQQMEVARRLGEMGAAEEESTGDFTVDAIMGYGAPPSP